MGACFSPAMSTSYRRLSRLLSFDSNSTTLLPTQQPPQAANPTGSVEMQPPSTPDEGHNQAQEDSKRIAELVQTRSLAVAAGSFTLLANPPKPETKLLGLYKMYLLFFLLSFVLSIGSLSFVLKSTRSRGIMWLQKEAMKIAIISIVIAVVLRIFLEVSVPFLWYEFLVPFLVLVGISLYLLYGSIKENSPTQTAGPGHDTSERRTSEVPNGDISNV